MLTGRLLCIVFGILVVASAPVYAVPEESQLVVLQHDARRASISITPVGKDSSQPSVFFGGFPAKVLKTTSRESTKTLEVELPAELKPGEGLLEVKLGTMSFKTLIPLEVPDIKDLAGNQPRILSIKPVGGFERDTITIIGRNFGDNIKKTLVVLGDCNLSVTPVSLSSPDGSGKQELTFSIPARNDEKPGENEPLEKSILGNRCLYQKADIVLRVDGHTSNWSHLYIVHPRGLWKIAGFSMFAVFLFISPFLGVWFSGFGRIVGIIILLAAGAILVYSLLPEFQFAIPAGVAVFFVCLLAVLSCIRTKGPRKIAGTLFLDKDTNTLSLAKVQSFAWTILILGTYLYFAIGRGILLGKQQIPDLNESLLVLMSISLGGLMAAQGVGKKMPKNDLASTPPAWSDLISEGGIISITRLQLVGFTIAAMIVFIYYVADAQVFVSGLPNIPPTLNGLLGISVGSYIGGKLVDGTSVNFILPKRVRRGTTVSVFGTGFVNDTKIIISGMTEPIQAACPNKNTLQLVVPGPDKIRDCGVKSLTFIPPTGSNFTIDRAIEIIDPKIENVRKPGNDHPNEPVQVTISGIEIGPGEGLLAKIAGEPANINHAGGKSFEIKTDKPLGDTKLKIELSTMDGFDFPVYEEEGEAPLEGVSGTEGKPGKSPSKPDDADSDKDK